MAATAALDLALTFTWYMGQTPSETHTAWECVALARAQTAKEEAQEKRWQEWAGSAADGEDEPDDVWYEQTRDAYYDARDKERAAARAAHCTLLKEIFGLLPFRPVSLAPAWMTPAVLNVAQAAYDNRLLPSGLLDSTGLAVLADALEEAGCTNAEILLHLRGLGPHVRGCWAVDAILGKT
jgi:hypothetical protein